MLAIAMPVLAIVGFTTLHAFAYVSGPPTQVVEQTARVASSVPASLKPNLDKVVESYRKIIVLLDDEALLAEEERTRCVDVGRKIHQEKQQLLDELTASLTADLRQAAATRFRERPATVDAFVDYFNSNTTLRDVDRLAFFDLADELLAVANQEQRAAGLAKSPTHSALQKINDDLKSIQNTYQKEVSRVFSSLGTRGKELKREKWQDYVAFLKKLFSREQVLNEYGRGKPEQQDESLRGARHDSKTEIYGYDLPAKSIVLTFDDGPHPRYTDEILAILKKYNAKAFFFDVGKNLGAVNPQNDAKLSSNSTCRSASSKRVIFWPITATRIRI